MCVCFCRALGFRVFFRVLGCSFFFFFWGGGGGGLGFRVFFLGLGFGFCRV